jgi:hypothetical protein
LYELLRQKLAYDRACKEDIQILKGCKTGNVIDNSENEEKMAVNAKEAIL